VPTTAGNPAVTVSPTTITRGTSTWAATSVSVAYTHDYLFLNPFSSACEAGLAHV
jgi:hypothetical protein